MIFTCESDEGLAGLWLYIGRIDHCQFSAGKPFADNRVKDVERVASGGLIILII
jgi:hypothetical protein